MPSPQHDLYQALAQAYRALADVVARPALAEDSRKSVLAALLVLEREMDVWKLTTLSGYELDFDTPPFETEFEREFESEFEDEPTHPGV